MAPLWLHRWNCYSLNYKNYILYIAPLHHPWAHLQPSIMFVQMTGEVTGFSLKGTVTPTALTVCKSVLTEITISYGDTSQDKTLLQFSLWDFCRQSGFTLLGNLSWTVCIDTQCTRQRKLSLLFIPGTTPMFPVDQEMPETDDDLEPIIMCTHPAMDSASIWN